MSEIKIPPIGTRVAAMSKFTISWMNQYRRPTIGIVAHSNAWDKPNTFRLVAVENPENKNYESVISLEHLEYLKVLGTSKDPENPQAVATPDGDSARSFEIQGSNDNVYTVVLDGSKSSCTCQAGRNGRLCKHVKAARELLAAE